MIFHMWVGIQKRKTPIDFEVNRSKVKVVKTGNRNILSAQYLPVRNRVRIGPPHPLVYRKRRLIGDL